MSRMARMRWRSRGTGPRTTKKRLGARSARACPSHAPKKTRSGARSARACPSHTSQKPLRLIKVLSDLSLLCLLMSIDIKVFQTFSPHSQAASHPANPAHPGHPASDKKARREKTNTPRAPIHAGAVKNRAYHSTYSSSCLTSPNVFNARCAGDTGPRNRRVTNVSALPPNETSSI